jgi:tripeptidyl-peptidase-1
VQNVSPLVSGESNVDFSISYSLIYPQSVVLYRVKEEVPTPLTTEVEKEYTGFVNILDAADGSFCSDIDKSSGFNCGTISLTKVVSLSYSSPELGWTNAAADRTCNEFMKLSLQGTTFVFASRDWGVASNPEIGSTRNGCIDRNNIDSTTDGTVFSPQFPSTCPYVLSVGATMLTPNQTVHDPESVMNIRDFQMGSATFSSSGGFANYATCPDYQKDAVSSYLGNYAHD